MSNPDTITAALDKIEAEKTRIRNLAANEAARVTADYQRQIAANPARAIALMQEATDAETRIVDQLQRDLATLERAAMNIATL